MGFQKKKVVIGVGQAQPGCSNSSPRVTAAGTKPSPVDGRLITSSGTASLDQLMAGHSGLPLGTSLLLQEHGTTDFGGIALRYFAAQGLVHGHHVHVLGYGEAWRSELPGLADGAAAKKGQTASSSPSSKEREILKIAWRYDVLGSKRQPSGLESHGGKCIRRRAARTIMCLTQVGRKPRRYYG
jgi:elongator complex protein 4